ncbi:hypothetical protein BCV70DRAFT_115347 [Testicularia cyperi]|uniref:Uncharacterized protein n=1 Tax=Testicularia cyperi TaxID=1882483 RepID=A0A317XLS7_9BASI|nr:hypothetical protein BCV70DRAFT_115347 [Testicularia cyperi]
MSLSLIGRAPVAAEVMKSRARRQRLRPLGLDRGRTGCAGPLCMMMCPLFVPVVRCEFALSTDLDQVLVQHGLYVPLFPSREPSQAHPLSTLFSLIHLSLSNSGPGMQTRGRSWGLNALQVPRLLPCSTGALLPSS